MHVVHDWYRLYVDTNRKRVKSLCYAKVVVSSAGIPGITKARPDAWCPSCISRLTMSLIEWFEQKNDTPNNVRLMYSVIASEALRARNLFQTEHYTNSLKGHLDADYAPVWSPTSKSFNNPLYVVWYTLIDRVYNPTNPDHSKGWYRHAVDKRWHDFNNFIEDAPHDGLKAVYPNAEKSEVIGPDSCKYYQESPQGRIKFG